MKLWFRGAEANGDIRVSPPRRQARDWIVRAILVALIALIIYGLARITEDNLRARGVSTGFGFLWRPAGIPIADSPLPFTAGVDPYARAVLIGLLNTLKISFLAILLATTLGTFVGLARLSSNWLLSRCCLVYVEITRNVPLLLQLLFWYQLFHYLPGPRQAYSPIDGVYLSNRGIRFPSVDLGPETGRIAGIALAGLAVACAIAWIRARRSGGTARGLAGFWLIAAGLAPGVAAAVLLGAAPAIAYPRLAGFDFRGGGILSVELSALLLGLTFYAASFVSEIVRSGVLAVPKGQWEAAGSLGLPRALILRKIVLPQTMRVVLPPMTSEYLSIVKNSSLAIAVGYPDLVDVVNGMISDTGQAIEGTSIIVAVYLVISLMLSYAMSRYETATALRER